MSRYYQA